MGHDGAVQSSNTGTKVCLGIAVAVLGFGVLLVGGFGALMWYGSSSSTAKLSEYFSFAEKATIAEIAETFRPELIEKCDPQLLAMLVKAVPQTFGAFKETKLKNFKFSDRYANGLRTREYSGPMVFEKGEVDMKIHFIDDKVIAFMIRDKEKGEQLLANRGLPPNEEPYRARGERFWRSFLGGNTEESFEMLGAPLQKQIGKQGFKVQAENLRRNGALKSVTFIKSMPTPDHPQKQLFLYECAMERATATGHVTFQYAGVTSLLMGYQIPSRFAKKEQ